MFSPSWLLAPLGLPVPPCALVLSPGEVSSGTAVSPCDSHLVAFGLYSLTAPFFLMQTLRLGQGAAAPGAFLASPAAAGRSESG